MKKEILQRVDSENINLGDLAVEPESQHEIEEYINSGIENADELARGGIMTADEIINNDSYTEDEVEIARQSKNKIISLGFYLKSRLNKLINLGLLGGVLFMNPPALLTGSGYSRPKNPILEYQCITGKNKDINPDYNEERAHLYSAYPKCLNKLELEKIRTDGEKEKQKLLDLISSGAYFEKLVNEYDSEDAAKDEQRERMSIVENSDFTVKEYLGAAGGVFAYRDDLKTFGIYICDANAVPEEYVHAFSVDRLTEETVDIINGSFVFDESLNSELSKLYDSNKTNLREYFGNTNERYAKLHVLKLKLDELGLKKYEEDFTKEHYDKLIELVNRYDSGEEIELDGDSIIFLKTTRGFGLDEGFRWLTKMFYEIATNSSDVNSNLA